MADKKTIADEAAVLRQRAEEMVWEKAVQSLEDIRALSPGEIQKTLHELRVHQIELEIQNEELRRTQVELDAARERYFDLYNLAPVGYVTLSEEGLVLEANLTSAILLGAARSALVNKPLSRFIRKEDQDVYYLHRQQLFNTGAPQSCDVRMVKKDGTTFWTHLVVTAAQDAGGAPLCRTVLSDITERKAAEEKVQLLNAELEQMALTDYLTNLYNRRYFMQHGAEEIKRANRNRQPLAVLMLDIDEFKKVNDTHGHQVGDAVLQQVAAVLKASLRETDIIGRLGGEEFGMLLPNTPLHDAALLAERIRQSIADMLLQTPGDALIGSSITISIGAAAFTTEMTSIDDLLRNADTAMYRAKNSGRNRVEV
jgi:diguanylate cyclase (GGDEF)-like protein/PAS domain S-box-containing protein